MANVKKRCVLTLHSYINRLGVVGMCKCTTNGCLYCDLVPLNGNFDYSLATECRTFLLYYLPLLCGILPDKYLAHVLLLSKAMRLLLGDQLSHADVEIAENLLKLFWRLTEKFYG